VSPRSRSVVYHLPRERRRAPALVVGLLGLAALVLSQLAVAGALPVPTVGPVPGSDAPSPAPPAEALPGSVEPSAGLGALARVPRTTVVFPVGAVLDDAALAELQPVLAVLTRPDAAPVLITGSAEPGVDDASALRLAQQRADAVAVALVEAGAPASLLRTTAVVDPGAARSVVVASEVP
jgi:outer membrane protein OmpA-like peptidoglycan-associated protein